MPATIKEGDRTFWMTVEKSGYETSELARSVEGAAATVLRFHQIRSVAAGESWQTVVASDDSACDYHWGYVCRRVRVIPQSSGTLTLQVVSDTPAVLGMLMGPVGFRQSSERRISVAVKAGTEVLVDVAADWQIAAPAEFTLNTSLTP